MAKKAQATPKGYHTVTPSLVVADAAKAIEFYKKALGAEERMRFPAPDGSIMHAEIRIGDSTIMMSDECPEMGARSPQSVGGSPVGLMIYVEDADAMFARAVKAGAQIQRAVQDQFYGDRSGTITDPFGHTWTISTHIEDVPPDEMKRRAAAYNG